MCFANATVSESEQARSQQDFLGICKMVTWLPQSTISSLLRKLKKKSEGKLVIGSVLADPKGNFYSRYFMLNHGPEFSPVKSAYIIVMWGGSSLDE